MYMGNLSGWLSPIVTEFRGNWVFPDDLLSGCDVPAAPSQYHFLVFDSWKTDTKASGSPSRQGSPLVIVRRFLQFHRHDQVRGCQFAQLKCLCCVICQ